MSKKNETPKPDDIVSGLPDEEPAAAPPPVAPAPPTKAAPAPKKKKAAPAKKSPATHLKKAKRDPVTGQAVPLPFKPGDVFKIYMEMDASASLTDLFERLKERKMIMSHETLKGWCAKYKWKVRRADLLKGQDNARLATYVESLPPIEELSTDHLVAGAIASLCEAVTRELQAYPLKDAIGPVTEAFAILAIHAPDKVSEPADRANVVGLPQDVPTIGSFKDRVVEGGKAQ